MSERLLMWDEVKEMPYFEIEKLSPSLHATLIRMLISKIVSLEIAGRTTEEETLGTEKMRLVDIFLVVHRQAREIARMLGDTCCDEEKEQEKTPNPIEDLFELAKMTQARLRYVAEEVARLGACAEKT